MNNYQTKKLYITSRLVASVALMCASAGSYALDDTTNLSITTGTFRMEVAPGSFLSTPVTGFNGVNLGTIQLAAGSHTGPPGCDGNLPSCTDTVPSSEAPNIDNAWAFFNNTGFHQTTSAPTVLSVIGDTATVSFAGWSVNWNGIPDIPMSGGAWNGNPDAVAQVTCAVGSGCADGSAYTLYYSATVPVGDPSSFGGVAYDITLDGTLTDTNTAPTCNADSGVVAPDGSGVIAVTSNDTDSDGTIDVATVAVVGGSITPAGATAVPNGAGGVTYTPPAAYTGAGGFSYTVDDNEGVTCAMAAAVSISVSFAPNTQPDSVTTDIDTLININVVANDTDDVGLDLTSIVTSNVTAGATATPVGDGTVNYTPPSGFIGVDTFSYTIDDIDMPTSNTSALTTVTVTVNDPPVANDDSATVNRHIDSSPAVTSVDINVTANDTDSDGTLNAASYVTVAGPSAGTITAMNVVSGNMIVTYEPDVNVIGTAADSFTYTIDDNTGSTSNTATVTIDVVNALPVAVDDNSSVATLVETNKTVLVTANDTDADGSIDGATIVTSSVSAGASAVPNTSGGVLYTPAPGFEGTDTFQYTVMDNDGGLSNLATVTMIVQPEVIPDLPDFLVLDTGSNTLPAVPTLPGDGNGSWFTMEVEPGSLTLTNLVGFNHIQLGVLQPAFSEGPQDIDAIWNFFGNNGVHQTTAPILELGGNVDTAVQMDFAGWNVSWNNIASIPLGAGADNGIATLVCGQTTVPSCSDGDTFILNYRATVPPGDPSGFGGVSYVLHLEGVLSDTAPVLGCAQADPYTVTDVIAMDDACGVGTTVTVTAGDIASAAGKSSGTGLTAAEVGINDPLFNPNDGAQCLGGCADFVLEGFSGTYVDLVFKLNAPLVDGAIYRKYINGKWRTFDESSGDQIGSQLSDAGACQTPLGLFSIGLREGNDCLFMRIYDNGPNDADDRVGVIADPSGVLLPGSPNVPASSSDGCSVSNLPVSLTARADWLVVVAFIAGMGMLAYRRRGQSIH